MTFLNIKIFISEMGSHLKFVAFLLRFVVIMHKKRYT